MAYPFAHPLDVPVIFGKLAAVLEINNVTKRFFTLTALDNVSLSIPRGEVLGILGPNGAGKTTFFKVIAGFLNPDSGSVRPTTPSFPAIGYKPERLLYPGKLRAGEYLRLVANLSGVPRPEVGRVVAHNLARVGLTAEAHKRIKDCSKGMRQRLGVAQALIADPPLLLLDEPSNGLDPEGQADIRGLIRELQGDGKTILLSSHQLNEVTQVCTHLVILNHGRIHYESSIAQALVERPHTLIRANAEVEPVREALMELHPDIGVNGADVTLDNDAVQMRRAVLELLLGAGYDIIHLEQQRVTLEELYARVVQ